MLKTFKISNDENYYLRQVEHNSKLAVATSFERARKLQSDSHLQIHCFNNQNMIHTYSLKLLLKKEFPLFNELNSFIQHASSGGLIVKWLKCNRNDSYSQKALFHYSDANLESFLFGGLLFTALTLLSFAIYIVEIFVYRRVQAQNNARFWRYFEMYIDPHRYLFLDTFDWCK